MSMSRLTALAIAIDRSTRLPLRWARLRAELQATAADEREARRRIQMEWAYQKRIDGDRARYPDWASAVLGPARAPEPAPVITVPVQTSRVHREPAAKSISDAAALRALVIALNSNRHYRVSEYARRWTDSQPGITHKWADEALQRLGDAGVLTKERGKGRANLPAWKLARLDVAMARLANVAPPKG